MENNKKRLQELKGSDFKIVDEQPDIKGWSIYDTQHRKLGEVEDLLFDIEMRKVRYIIADLDGNDLDLDSKEVLIPIGIAELHESDDEVILPGVTASQLSSLPEYNDDGDLSHADESAILAAFAGAGAAAFGTAQGTDSDRYNHEHFDDQKLYRNRSREKTAVGEDENVIPVFKEELSVGKEEIETGRIRLRSRIVEEPVEQEIPLRSEKVDIERRAVDRPATSDEFREQEIDMRIKEEVPVVSKEARVVEEIRLSKEETEEDVTIRDTVRETKVDISRDKDTNNLNRQ